MSLPSLSTDWPIYKSYLPDGDNVEDNAGSIYDYFSEEHSCLRTTGNGRHYGLQVMVRSLDYEAGHYKSQEILDALDGLQNEPIEFGDYNYEIQVVVPISGVNCIGREPNTKSRYLFTLNFTSVIKYLEAA